MIDKPESTSPQTTTKEIFKIIVDSITSITKEQNLTKTTDLNKLNIDSLGRIEILMEVEKRLNDTLALPGFSLGESILEQGSTIAHFTEAVQAALEAAGAKVEAEQGDV
jgi:acyl carrier protein